MRTHNMKDSDRGLVPDRGPLPRSGADSTSRADSDRAFPQRGPISLSAENAIFVSLHETIYTIRRT